MLASCTKRSKVDAKPRKVACWVVPGCHKRHQLLLLLPTPQMVDGSPPAPTITPKSECGMRSGYCWLFQNLMSWPTPKIQILYLHAREITPVRANSLVTHPYLLHSCSQWPVCSL